MNNPLQNSAIGNMNQMGNMFQSFMQNPMQFLLQRRINIPQQFQNDPHGAVQYLLNNGQMKQEDFNRLSQMANQMGIKLN